MKLTSKLLCLRNSKRRIIVSLLLLCSASAFAQGGSKAVKVTISPSSGNIISVRSESSQEAGSQSGYGSMLPVCGLIVTLTALLPVCAEIPILHNSNNEIKA